MLRRSAGISRRLSSTPARRAGGSGVGRGGRCLAVSAARISGRGRKDQGIRVSDRGGIPASVAEQYEAATEGSWPGLVPGGPAGAPRGCSRQQRCTPASPLPPVDVRPHADLHRARVRPGRIWPCHLPATLNLACRGDGERVQIVRRTSSKPLLTGLLSVLYDHMVRSSVSTFTASTSRSRAADLDLLVGQHRRLSFSVVLSVPHKGVRDPRTWTVSVSA